MRSRALRKEVVDRMKSRPNKIVKGAVESFATAIQDAVQNNPKKYKTIKQYLQKMKRKGEYAGQPEIYALSDIYNINIVTLVDNGNNYKSYGGALSCIRNRKLDTIYLLHNANKHKSAGSHHFEALWPKANGTIISSTTKKKTRPKTRRRTRRTQRTRRVKRTRRKLSRRSKRTRRKLSRRSKREHRN